MKCVNQFVVGKFLIQDSTKILNRGFFLIGELIDGKIETGNFVQLNFNSLTESVEIEQIEEVRAIKNEIPTNLIALKISTEFPEILVNQIKESHKEIIVTIYKK